MPIRKYPLPQDALLTPLYAGDDGTRFYTQRVYNTGTLPGADSDDGAGVVADFGVHDNDVYGRLGLTNYQSKNPTLDNTDETLTFTGVVHQVYLDNSRATAPLYVEFGALTATTSSLAVPIGAFLIAAVELTVMHVYCADHTKVQIRGA